MISDYVISLQQSIRQWILPHNCDELYERREKAFSASYYEIPTKSMLSEEGIQWFASKDVPLRKSSWVLCSTPNNRMIIHTDFSPCCFIFNLQGQYDIYWLRDEGIVNAGRFETMNYILPDKSRVHCTKNLDIRYRDMDNLPVIDGYNSPPMDVTLIETKTIHYGVSGPSERFIFWSPRPVDITLDFAEVKRRLFQ